MKPILYADDSSFFYSYNKNVDPTNIINPELVKIVKWLNVNKLSLNIKKSNFIIFCPSYKQKGPELIPKIELQGQQIQQVAQTKFLGFIIENIAVKTRSDSHARKSLAPVVSEKCPR